MRAHAPTPHAWELLGNHLRQARITQRVPQTFVAEWIGIDHATVARIEMGRGMLLVSHLSAMELALGLRPGVSLEVLARGGQPATRPHLPSRPPTRLELSTETTLCGHTPRCTEQGGAW